MVEYRTFRNADPPKLLALWNASRESRAFGVLRSCDALDALLFSKLYFDPAGLIVAESEGQVVGFAHAGFGASDDKRSLDKTLGAVYMVRVHPEFRRRGIGTQLLHHGQAYLINNGVGVQYFGGMFPLNAFYLGLYGGSELPGLLETDGGTRAFATAHGYEPHDMCLVYHRRLDELPRIADTRIALLRRTVEVQAEPWPIPDNWWDGCVHGAMPSLRYEMIERETQELVGQALVWEMECFGAAWGIPTVGIVDFRIEPDFRRRGYGKLLLLTMMKHLREQQIELLELQTMSTNEPARGLYEELGFQHVDTGQAFRLSKEPDFSTLPPLVKRTPAPRSPDAPHFQRRNSPA